jgi:hypothetical protein
MRYNCMTLREQFLRYVAVQSTHASKRYAQQATSRCQKHTTAQYATSLNDTVKHLSYLWLKVAPHRRTPSHKAHPPVQMYDKTARSLSEPVHPACAHRGAHTSASARQSHTQHCKVNVCSRSFEATEVQVCELAVQATGCNAGLRNWQLAEVLKCKAYAGLQQG